MNTNVVKNYSKLKATLFLLPLFILISIPVYLYAQHSLSVNEYIQIQKKWFFFLNAHLSQFPVTEDNLTQLGDALILLSFLAIFIVYASKLWESLIMALLVSVIFSDILKNIFAVPRPAATFESNSFVIIGKALYGHNSLPSGHSITVFTILTVLLFAFMPQKWSHKLSWAAFMVITGLVVAFTRVGVGAHYPLDVITGCVVGYISGLAGIFITRKYKVCNWINSKKCYPGVILLFVVCVVVIIGKIVDENLAIFYLSIASLVVSLYKIISVYGKK